MENLLKKLKLIENTTTTLQLSKVEFIKKLNEITEPGDTGFLSSSFDIFSSSKKEFKGIVNYDSFKIKRRRRLFDSNANIAVANGTVIEKNGELIIDTQINAFNNFFIAFYIFLIIFYSIFFSVFLFSDMNTSFIAIPFLLFHATLMFGLPYFMMRRSVKKLKYELERDFFYLTK